MTPENINQIRMLHWDYYHSSIDVLPDGWMHPVMHFLSKMADIGDLTDSVSIRFERCPDGLRAFTFPEMTRWSDDQLRELKDAQQQLLDASRSICEQCGIVPAGPVRFGDAHQFLCAEHKTEARTNFVKNVQQLDNLTRKDGGDDGSE